MYGFDVVSSVNRSSGKTSGRIQVAADRKAHDRQGRSKRNEKKKKQLKKKMEKALSIRMAAAAYRIIGVYKINFSSARTLHKVIFVSSAKMLGKS